jgi:hypothetical protein
MWAMTAVRVFSGQNTRFSSEKKVTARVGTRIGEVFCEKNIRRNGQLSKKNMYQSSI